MKTSSVKIGMDIEKTPADAKRRAMLHSYEQQLLAARRLARFRVRMMSRAGLDSREPDPAEKRHNFVQSVANELFQSLVFTGISTPIMEEIRQELGQKFQQEFEFVYPPDSNLCIYIRDGEKLRPLSELEQHAVTQALMHITNEKVDKGMLRKSARSGLLA